MIEVAAEELMSELPDLPARYDAEARVLDIPVISGEEWMKGIDLDALVVIDLTEDLAVANIEVLTPRERWKPGLPVQVTDRGTSPVRLRVTPAAVARKSFRSTPSVHTSPDGATVQIVVPDNAPATAVKLTKQCVGLIRRGQLAGFEVHLPNK